MVLSWAKWNCSSDHTRWCSLDIFFLTMWGFSWRAWPFFPGWGRGWGPAVGTPLYGTAPRLQLGRYQSRNAPANTHKNDFRRKVAFPVFFVPSEKFLQINPASCCPYLSTEPAGNWSFDSHIAWLTMRLVVFRQENGRVGSFNNDYFTGRNVFRSHK